MKKLDRIDAYGRYLELLEAQQVALQAGDLALFGVLAEERDELAAGLNRLPPAADAVAARALLARCLDVDFRVRERLHALRDEARNRLRDMKLRRPALVPYLTAQAAGERLDRVS